MASICSESPTFFLSTSAAVWPKTTAGSAASRGIRPETSLRCFHANPSHSRADNIIICEFSMLINSTKRAQVADTCGSWAMRSRTETLNGLGVREVLILLTTTSVPRALNPTSQLFSKPREIPTSATTAPMPMEMPTSVNPVRTGRTHQAADHNGKKCHLSLRRKSIPDLRRSFRPSSATSSMHVGRWPCRASPAPVSFAAPGGAAR